METSGCTKLGCIWHHVRNTHDTVPDMYVLFSCSQSVIPAGPAPLPTADVSARLALSAERARPERTSGRQVRSTFTGGYPLTCLHGPDWYSMYSTHESLAARTACTTCSTTCQHRLPAPPASTASTSLPPPHLPRPTQLSLVHVWLPRAWESSSLQALSERHTYLHAGQRRKQAA